MFRLIIGAVILCALLYYGYVALAMFGIVDTDGERFSSWSALIPFAGLFASGNPSRKEDAVRDKAAEREPAAVDDTTASVPKRKRKKMPASE